MILKRLISNLGRTPFTVQIKCQSYQASKRPFQFHPNFDPDWKAKFEESFEVFDHFVSEDEEKSLLNEVEPHLKRLVYEKDHWDNAISGFRETERKHWNPKNVKVIERLKTFAFPPDLQTLPYVHVLDLAADGHIKPHIDSVRFCGDIVAVLSLMSDAVARFVLDQDKSNVVDCLVPKRSLYIMKGSSRHDFTHEILANSESRLSGKVVVKDRRISVVCRCLPKS